MKRVITFYFFILFYVIKVVLQIEKESKKKRKSRQKYAYGHIYNKWMRDKIDFSEVENA